MKIPKELILELRNKMSLSRLAKTGLFIKLPFEQGDGVEEISREIRLHRAVLDKALIDNFSEIAYIKNDVENWLDLNNKEFRDACDRAMLEPELVYATFKGMNKILQGDNAKFKKFGPRKRNTNESK